MGESPMAFFILYCRMQIEDFFENSERNKPKDKIRNPKGGGGHGAGPRDLRDS